MTADAARNPRRLPRFSLRSLILFVVLVTSGYGLWYRWEPWQSRLLLQGHSGVVSNAVSSSVSSSVSFRRIAGHPVSFSKKPCWSRA